MTAHTARMPITTPMAMPVLFGPFESPVFVLLGTMALVCPGAVTTTVLALVTTDGGTFLEMSGIGVAAEDELEVAESESELGLALESESGTLSTELSTPVNWTDHVFGPPPKIIRVIMAVE